MLQQRSLRFIRGLADLCGHRMTSLEPSTSAPFQRGSSAHPSLKPTPPHSMQAGGAPPSNSQATNTPSDSDRMVHNGFR
ncbi:hypothetical protein GN956_G5754 [Arapaima gigas]